MVATHTLPTDGSDYSVWGPKLNNYLNAVKQGINVKEYGAKGDGSTDDTDAIQAAEAAADDNGGMVYFPPGTYSLDADLTVSSNVVFQFSAGAKIQVETTRTLTFANVAQIIAPWGNDCFDTNGSGAISFTSEAGIYSDGWTGGTIGNFGLNTTTLDFDYALTSTGRFKSEATVNQRTAASYWGKQIAETLQSGTGFTGTNTTMSTQWIAVKFTASAAHTMGNFRIRVKESANITNTIRLITGYIYADDGGSPSKPTGSALATGKNVRFGQLTNTYQVLTLGTFLDLTASTDYWLVIKYNVAPTGGNVVLDSDVSANMGATSPDGTNWTNTTARLYYEIRGRTWVGCYGYSTNENGVYGTSQTEPGVYGISAQSSGVRGDAISGAGVEGVSTYGNGGLFSSTDNSGVRASSTNGNAGEFIGKVEVGENSSTQGILTLWDGAGGNTPAHVKIHSPNGTAWYLFVEDDGTLKAHNAAPTQNSDGSAVGDQTN